MNISKDNFQKIIDNLTAYEQEVKIFEVKFAGLDGWFSFDLWYSGGGKYVFRFWSRIGPYYEFCCVESTVLVCFQFNTYCDFISQFKKAEKLLCICHCDFHTLHRIGEQCPALFDDGKNVVCAICQEEKPALQLEKTLCGHLFCLSCLNKWVDMENVEIAKNGDYKAYRCPLCREDLGLCVDCLSPNKFCSCGE
jgi:hypothetical protein